VISDLADQGMSTRVFSDDPDVVTQLCKGFASGVKKSGVITTFKHFPGVGDGSDEPTAVPISLDNLKEKGLKVFGELVGDDGNMIMVSATTFPAFDDTYVLGDGKTKGYYPACMSRKIVTDMLRGDLGFGGVVVTDALEMKPFVEEPGTKAMLLAGDPKSAEHQIAVAERCLAAGCDILLVPADLKDSAAATLYDDLIAGLAAKVKDGGIDQEHLDESVRRVLSLKQKYELLVPKHESVEAMVSAASEVVGSDEHHGIERKIAERAVTMLKGDGVLPLDGTKTRLVIVGRTKTDANPIDYALSELMEKGKVDAQAYVDNRLTGKTTGSADSATYIFIDCYFDADGDGKLVYSTDLSEAIAKADAVLCLSAVPAGIDVLQDSNPCMQGISRALEEAHAAGAEFVLLSDNLPVDAARFADADAIVCAYLSAGFSAGPTTEGGSTNLGGTNANVPAAIRAIFGMQNMPGTLPIDVKMLKKGKDGKYAYANKVLYPRGSGGGKD
jgi:beta-N-acetylhexosaminidase